MNKNIEDLTIGELTEMGADIKVYFHRHEDLSSAFEKLMPFSKLNSIKRKDYDGMTWANVKGDVNGKEVSFSAFTE